MIPSKEEAWDLLCRYNTGDFHRLHAQIVGDVLAWFAEQLGYGSEKELWRVVGILHDLDYEQFPEQHCIKEQEWMRQAGIDENIIRAAASHGWGITTDMMPTHEMEKVLYATDELTGLIGAVVKMLPTKTVQDLEVKTLKKKFKDKRFAAGCSREVITRGAELLGWDMDTLFEKTIEAMRHCPAVD